MIPLHTLKVASPCHADWDEMEGDDQVRFCGGCRKNVYNLSEMSHADAQALVNRLEGRLCVRFYTRADGTLLTQDCPVGLRAVRRKLVKKLSYAAAVLLSCASGLLRGTGAAPAATAAKKHSRCEAAGGQAAARSERCDGGAPTTASSYHGTIDRPTVQDGRASADPPTAPFREHGKAYLGGMHAPPVLGEPVPAPPPVPKP